MRYISTKCLIGFVLLIALATISFSSKNSHAQSNESVTDRPGPFIKTIDYDMLFKMEQAPAYRPFEVYGVFLMSVAMQQTPLVLDLSKPVPDQIQKFTDVVFKEVGGQKIAMDIYNEKGDPTPNPLILIIHGGYWKTGDKSVHQFNAIEFAEMGYTVASVNYRLSDQAKFPANVEDVFDAIKFLTNNASTYNIDPSRIATWGGSAGGHLSGFVGLAANSSDFSFNTGVDASAIKAVITMYGMHDLTLPIQREHPFTKKYIGKDYDEAPDLYSDASPVKHADPEDPPVLIIHGSLDGSVSVLNSDALSHRLKQVDVPYVYDRIDGWPHAMDFFSPIAERSLWFAYQFLKEHMPSDKM